MSNSAFVYKWTHLPTLRWYIGSRTAKGCSINDGYICSSKKVKPLIESAQSEWSREVIAIGSPADMLELETVILELFDARNDPRSYNQHNGDGRFTTLGIEPHNKGKYIPRNKPSWNSGKKAPQISAAKKGKPAKNKGVPMSEEQKLKLSLVRKGNPSPKKGLPGIPSTPDANAKRSATLTGRIQSAEHIQSRANSRRGKKNPNPSPMLGRPKPKLVSRLVDKKPMTIANFIQWCGLVDTQIKTKGT
jgi:hypothetical protein